MTLKHFSLSLSLIKAVFTIITLIIIGLFLKDMYFYVLSKKEMFNLIIHSDFSLSNENNRQELIAVGKFFGLATLFLIIKLVAMVIVFAVFHKIPVPTSILGGAYITDELSPAFARILINHYRANHYLSIKEFLAHYPASQKETYYFNNHTKNKYLLPIFKKYDLHFTQDKTFLDKTNSESITRKPNKTTVKAIQECETGKAECFHSVDELSKDLTKE